MANPRLTKVQRDVLDRMRDGWELMQSPDAVWILQRPGFPSRHVDSRTAWSLFDRKFITMDYGATWGKWVLAS